MTGIKDCDAGYPLENYHTAVYNLTIEDYHTYFVGEWGLWVHNACFKGVGINNQMQHERHATRKPLAKQCQQHFNPYKPAAFTPAAAAAPADRR